jgi:hypothetical protein
VKGLDLVNHQVIARAGHFTLNDASEFVDWFRDFEEENSKIIELVNREE